MNESDYIQKSTYTGPLLETYKDCDVLVHASRCDDTACCWPSCLQVKGMLDHVRGCSMKISGNCTICRQLWWVLRSHATQCSCTTHDECPTPHWPKDHWGSVFDDEHDIETDL